MLGNILNKNLKLILIILYNKYSPNKTRWILMKLLL